MSKNKLILEMGIFFILVFGAFTYIVIYEKKDIILKPKVEEKLANYIDKNYTNIKNEIQKDEIQYDKKNDTYYINLINNENKNLKFNVSFHNKKIKSTYEKDYKEGRSLIKYLEEKTEKEITNKTEYKTKVYGMKKLNQYTEESRNKIIQKNNLKEVQLYNLSVTMKTKKFNSNHISDIILNYEKQVKSLKYEPKEYEFLIINNQNKKINKSLKIKHLNNTLIENNLNEIINRIIDNDDLVKEEYQIDYEYIY